MFWRLYNRLACTVLLRWLWGVWGFLILAGLKQGSNIVTCREPPPFLQVFWCTPFLLMHFLVTSNRPCTWCSQHYHALCLCGVQAHPSLGAPNMVPRVLALSDYFGQIIIWSQMWFERCWGLSICDNVLFACQGAVLYYTCWSPTKCLIPAIMRWSAPNLIRGRIRIGLPSLTTYLCEVRARRSMPRCGLISFYRLQKWRSLLPFIPVWDAPWGIWHCVFFSCHLFCFLFCYI